MKQLQFNHSHMDNVRFVNHLQNFLDMFHCTLHVGRFILLELVN